MSPTTARHCVRFQRPDAGARGAGGTMLPSCGTARSGPPAPDEAPEPANERLVRLLSRPIDGGRSRPVGGGRPAVVAACTSPALTPLAVASDSASPSPTSTAPPTPASPGPQPADWVFVGGPVLTMEPGTRADGIAIRGERIVAVGAAADVLELVGDGTRLVVSRGRAVMPGFVDPHQHIGGPVATEGGDLAAAEDEAPSYGYRKARRSHCAGRRYLVHGGRSAPRTGGSADAPRRRPRHRPRSRPIRRTRATW